MKNLYRGKWRAERKTTGSYGERRSSEQCFIMERAQDEKAAEDEFSLGTLNLRYQLGTQGGISFRHLEMEVSVGRTVRDSGRLVLHDYHHKEKYS